MWEEGSGWWARVPAGGILGAAAGGHPRRGPLPGGAERWGPGRESKGAGLPSVRETRKSCFVGNRELWVLAGLEEGFILGLRRSPVSSPTLLPSGDPACATGCLHRCASPGPPGAALPEDWVPEVGSRLPWAGVLALPRVAGGGASPLGPPWFLTRRRGSAPRLQAPEGAREGACGEPSLCAQTPLG